MVVSRTKPPPLWVRQCSVAGTNMKVGAPRKWGGGTDPTGKNWSRPYSFLALKVRLVVLVSAFMMVITVWSVGLACLRFFYSLTYPYRW